MKRKVLIVGDEFQFGYFLKALLFFSVTGLSFAAPTVTSSWWKITHSITSLNFISGLPLLFSYSEPLPIKKLVLSHYMLLSSNKLMESIMPITEPQQRISN